MLAAARAFQDGFGALLAPAALSLMTTTFTDSDERNRAFGIWGAIAGSGAAIGLILGGVLTQALSWRYSMYVNLIFATIAIVGALALLHNQSPAVKPRLDIPPRPRTVRRSAHDLPMVEHGDRALAKLKIPEGAASAGRGDPHDHRRGLCPLAHSG